MPCSSQNSIAIFLISFSRYSYQSSSIPKRSILSLKRWMLPCQEWMQGMNLYFFHLKYYNKNFLLFHIHLYPRRMGVLNIYQIKGLFNIISLRYFILLPFQVNDQTPLHPPQLLKSPQRQEYFL